MDFRRCENSWTWKANFSRSFYRFLRIGGEFSNEFPFLDMFFCFLQLFTECNFFGCTCPTAPLWYLPIFQSGCAAEMLLTLLDVFIFWIFPRWLERFVQRLLYLLCYFDEKRLFWRLNLFCPFVSILFNLFEIKCWWPPALIFNLVC